MKKIMLVAGFMAAVAASAAPASAGPGGLIFEPYGAVGVGTLNIKQTGFVTGTPSFTKMGSSYQTYAYAAMGAKLHEYFSIEMRLGATKADANNTANVNTKATADYVWSLLAKPQMYITDNAILYPLLGATTARIAGPGVGSPSGISTVGTMASSGFTYGLGAEYVLNDNISGGFEFVRYMKVDATPPNPNKLTLEATLLI